MPPHRRSDEVAARSHESLAQLEARYAELCGILEKARAIAESSGRSASYHARDSKQHKAFVELAMSFSASHHAFARRLREHVHAPFEDAKSTFRKTVAEAYSATSGGRALPGLIAEYERVLGDARKVTARVMANGADTLLPLSTAFASVEAPRPGVTADPHHAQELLARAHELLNRLFPPPERTEISRVRP